MTENHKIAVFGGGCFWCTEVIFTTLKGVIDVKPGYMGGSTENPTYKDVCTGETGHAEVIQIVYDEKQISFSELLLVFFKTHDPTTLNRQGNDIGTQYRSVVFYYDEDQKQQAEEMIAQLTKEEVFDSPIVTEISPATKFYVAENYHHNYYANNRSQPYCLAVIQPKVLKFAEKFKDKIKPELL
ncbi:peptide methionine sulfoxide reductase [Pseudopedobacter saltans DSM 12145]|uniref:Peptide methionine sulfoxide reductase MsrA n=1 Tax=Pseudopedobacter saltans (strain ATCC 51119 / DSM 12145 / JCM 21818 / CCUG 39354 / LMG 10337 / NBRC 100064 / NCIMB 13643) TaxID=762903 RepID=F0SBM7_PSESL|nr:peptide-methionine (S)-S-oxide reductase MsrA [Pseudopedobacter saltans]ADY52718.1 peptide methionine sulfoxide reductase [Pseudopedobacter saltans DSM 12145]